MPIRWISRLSLALALGVCAPPAAAHHAFAAVFDENAVVDITGTVARLEWMNPHVWFYIDVPGENGTVQSWALEMGSPNGLVRQGWSRRTLNVGDTVRVVGYQAKDHSPKASVKAVTLPDGKQLSGLSSK